MTILQLPAPKSTADASPADWPAWCDEFTWELGPDPDEAAEAAAIFGPLSDARDALELVELDVIAIQEGTIDFDLAALEAAALDAMELGLIPADLAEVIARTSLVGPTVDAILHEGSDPRFCTCEPCVWDRTRRYAE